MYFSLSEILSGFVVSRIHDNDDCSVFYLEAVTAVRAAHENRVLNSLYVIAGGYLDRIDRNQAAPLYILQYSGSAQFETSLASPSRRDSRKKMSKGYVH